MKASAVEIERHERANGPMHTWFGLSYSSYLVLNRSAIQQMPVDWQLRLVTLLDEMEEVLDTSEMVGRFMVRARSEDGRFIEDPYRNYRRGPRIPERKTKDAA